MTKFHVTLKAVLRRGELYWVSDVEAADEDAALDTAEAEFMAEIETPGEWSFSEADVEAI